MLRRSLVLLFAVLFDICMAMIDRPFGGPHATLMALVARSIYNFDYSTPFLAFSIGFLFDAWHLDIFGGHAVTWLLTLFLITRVTRFFNSEQISAHLVLGFAASLVASFVHFIVWSSVYRTGTPLAAIFSQLIVTAMIDAVVLALLYRAIYSTSGRRKGMFTEVAV